MYWDETLDLEMNDIIDQCSKSDTDFEFVIDQSGSGMVFLSAIFSIAAKPCSQSGDNDVGDIVILVTV